MQKTVVCSECGPRAPLSQTNSYESTPGPQTTVGGGKFNQILSQILPRSLPTFPNSAPADMRGNTLTLHNAVFISGDRLREVWRTTLHQKTIFKLVTGKY